MAFAYTLEGASGLGQESPQPPYDAAYVSSVLAALASTQKQRLYWAIGTGIVGLVAGIFIGRAVR